MNSRNREDGTPEALWQEAEWGNTLSQLPLDGMKRLVVVSAHPGDETLAAGGLLARAAGLGLPVTVLVLSSGEASHPASPTHSPEELAARRRREVTDAVGILAPGAPVRLLNLPDGSLAMHAAESAEAVAAELGAGGRETWVVAPWRADGNPDHAAAGEAAAAAALAVDARLFEYPVWAWRWSTPDSDVWPRDALRMLRLSGEELELKSRALAAHRSQVEPLSALPGDEAVLAHSFGAHFTRRFETFIEAPATGDEIGLAAGPVPPASLTEAFFDAVYSGSADTGGFEKRWYETRKRSLTLAALRRERFGAALELGCGIGVLTAELAERCDTILATDVAEHPLRLARARLAGHTGVIFERRTLPGEWPGGTFDLIVLSEVGYYLAADALRGLLERCRDSLAPHGVLLACHWRHPVPQCPLSGDQVHEELARLGGLERTARHEERHFLLEVFEREGPAP